MCYKISGEGDAKMLLRGCTTEPSEFAPETTYLASLLNRIEVT